MDVEEQKLAKAEHARAHGKRMTFFLVVAAVFYISVAPIFGSISISYFTLRQFLWLSFLLIGLAFRLAGMV